ncbi:MAG: PHA/PHB synthase family protein [Tagaea sp.]|nr:class I poly(R)-hydroxyalkanoic acid synthase [Azospirillum sp.]MCA3267942.1 class I poly(R)-hydroxyalkanoic acid synthase [Azospirillum sp.]
MADKPDREAKMPDPLQMSQMMTDIAERSQRVVADFLSRQSPMAFGNPDPLNLGQAFFDMTARMMQNPAKLVQAQISLWQDYMSLWQSTTRKMLGEPSEPVATPAADDRRFKDALWDENYVFDFIKQSYLLSARWLQGRVKEVEGLDDKTARKVDFYTRQFVDAMAPSNFAMTNPEVVRETLDTGGENLVKGLQNLLGDLERGKGKLQIRMTDMDAFRVGENIAVTPGAVVYRNDLMELIHYKPTTETVVKAPLLIVPPWINKFYILDLREKNSFIKWAVDQGHSVFVISWVNPDAELAEKSFDDYMVEGPLAAMDAIEKATGERQVDIIGYCLGGTLTACTLAYLAAKGEKRVASATFFTTMVDFEEAGELSVFIDEEQLAAIEEKMNERGFLDGAEMASTFNMLRANDLIWSFVVNNYLLGKEPFPFDLLYWNSDSTRMPAAMHSFYLRQMYQENRLSRGKIKLLGTKIDLTKIDVPVFILSTREDHIAPWKSTYVATQLYTGPTTFCLAASGHIAGVVNPPAGNKYCHWTSDKLPKKPDQWLESATQHPGSWWPTWDAWVKGFAGEQVPARSPGEGKLKVIGPAPGSYVKVKAQ